jgi:hypothetical protein
MAHSGYSFFKYCQHKFEFDFVYDISNPDFYTDIMGRGDTPVDQVQSFRTELVSAADGRKCTIHFTDYPRRVHGF